MFDVKFDVGVLSHSARVIRSSEKACKKPMMKFTEYFSTQLVIDDKVP